MIPGTLNWALGLLTYRGRAGKPAMLAPVVHKLRELRDALEANPPLEAPVLAEVEGWVPDWDVSNLSLFRRAAPVAWAKAIAVTVTIRGR